MNRHLYAIAALALWYTSPCIAQTKEPDSLKNGISMNEIIISANKTEEKKKSVAQQVLVLDSKQIANAQAQTTADLLANTAGIFVQKSQMGGGSPVLRGFEANKVLIVVDGVRLNNIIYRGGHLQNVITIDNSMLDRMEVLFGPSSTVYGSDALGGVIHFYTKKPLFSEAAGKTNLGVNAYTRYGSVNNEMTGHVDFNIGGKRFAALTSLTYSAFGDLIGGKSQNPFYDSVYGERPFYVDRVNGTDTLLINSDKYRQVNSGYSQYDILQKFSFWQNEHVLHSLNLQYSTSTDIPRYDRLTDPSATGGLRFAQWYYGPQQRAMVAYNVDGNKESSFFQKRQVSINYQDIMESRHNRSFGSNNLSHRVEHVGVLGININAKRHAGDHDIRVGLESQRNTLKSTAERENINTGARVPTDTRYPDGKNTMDNIAAYGSHTWRINERFTVTDGLRLGYVSLSSTFVDTSFFQLPFLAAIQNNFVYSGSLGLIHTPTDKWKLSLLVSSGFRAPNVDDLAKVFESAPGSLIVPNINLAPEKTLNTELGITKQFGHRIIWENAMYYTRFIDAIVTAPYSYMGQDSMLYNGVTSRILANQNMGSAYIYGFSSNVRSKLTDYFLLSAGVNYTYGRIVTDSTAKPLDHIPPLQLRLQVTYTKNKLGADFFINYQGAKELKDYYLNGEDNEQYATPIGMPAWMTANLRVSYKVHKYITLQAGVDNILDTQYRVFASGINAPGRNVFGVIRFNY
jgi:hemoglobin/transferrin/lactoferrin receptor protein